MLNRQIIIFPILFLILMFSANAVIWNCSYTTTDTTNAIIYADNFNRPDNLSLGNMSNGRGYQSTSYANITNNTFYFGSSASTFLGVGIENNEIMGDNNYTATFDFMYTSTSAGYIAYNMVNKTRASVNTFSPLRDGDGRVYLYTAFFTPLFYVNVPYKFTLTHRAVDKKCVLYATYSINNTYIGAIETDCTQISTTTGTKIGFYFSMNYAFAKIDNFMYWNSTKTNGDCPTLPAVNYPVLVLDSQNPSIVSSTNLLNNVGLNITYNVTSTNGINDSTVKLFFKFNTSKTDTEIFVNGVGISGYYDKTYFEKLSAPKFKFRLFDNEIYPAIYNYDEQIVEDANHYSINLNSVNKAYGQKLFNYSPTGNYSFLEIMANTTIKTATNILEIYIGNSTYTTGNIKTNPNIKLLCNILGNQTINHRHNISFHYVCPMGFNLSSRTVNGLSFHDGIVNIIYTTSGNWDLWTTVLNGSRNNVTTTTNNGNTWSTESGRVIDSHIHLNFENYFYYACETDNASQSACSDVTFNKFGLTQLPPNVPEIYEPQTGYNRTYASFWINNTVPISPVGNQIVSYERKLLDSSFNFISIINISNEPYYLFDSSALSGNYKFSVTACDNSSLCSTGFSQTLYIDNTNPTITQIYPISVLNIYNTQNSLTFDVNVQDDYLDMVNFSIFRVSDGYLAYNNQTTTLLTSFNITDTVNVSNFTIGTYYAQYCARDSFSHSPDINLIYTTDILKDVVVTHFTDTVTGIMFDRYVNFYSDNIKQDLSKVSGTVINSYDLMNKHIITSIEFEKSTINDYTMISYQCIKGCKNFIYLNDRGQKRIVDDGYHFYINYDSDLDLGRDVLFSTNQVIVKPLAVELEIVSVGDITGGLNKLCVNSSAINILNISNVNIMFYAPVTNKVPNTYASSVDFSVGFTGINMTNGTFDIYSVTTGLSIYHKNFTFSGVSSYLYTDTVDFMPLGYGMYNYSACASNLMFKACENNNGRTVTMTNTTIIPTVSAPMDSNWVTIALLIMWAILLSVSFYTRIPVLLLLTGIFTIGLGGFLFVMLPNNYAMNSFIGMFMALLGLMFMFYAVYGRK